MQNEQPSILLALLSRSRWSDARGLIGGWDMIDAGCPSREQLQESAAVLIGSGLAEFDEPWRLRLTEDGESIRHTTGGRRLGMRELPTELDRILRTLPLARVPAPLPAETYRAALAEYLAPRRPGLLRRVWSALNGRPF